MQVFRPVTTNDLDSLLQLAELAGFGLTTLPKDRELLAERTFESIRSFERMGQRARGETYLFVMEDMKTGRVVGTAGIVSKVGGFEPFYAYRIESEVHESEMLSVHKEIQTLHLVMDHNGPCEIGSLFLNPTYRSSGTGRLLSVARLLFIAEHPERFDPTVIAEMRGRVDEKGGSTFWDAVGRHFFDIDYPKADYLSMVNKKFIADLMPRHPIYIPLLPKEAQDVVAKVHKETEAALKILEREGFAFSGMVDIFEAGPVVSCKRDKIRAVADSAKAKIIEIVDDHIESDEHAVANVSHDFRACRASIDKKPDGIRITTGTALALHVKVGDVVRFVPLRPSASKEVVSVTTDESFHPGPLD